MIAHMGEGAGGTFVVVLAALAAVAAGLRLRSRDGAMSAAAWGLLLGGAIVGVTAVIASTGSGSGSGSARPDVRLTVTPPTGIELPAGKPVEVSVDVEGAPVAASPADRTGGHVHVFLDGVLQEMAYGTKATIVFKPGPHTVRFEYVDNRHASFEPPAVAEARYTAR